MRKAFSIILLVVFLFNVGGYFFVFWILRLHTDHLINQRLDNHQYDHEETVELKIPVSLPYPLQSQDFERVSGRFEHNGEFFRLVKQKLENDTLRIVCVVDRETRRLVNTIDHYTELTQATPAAPGKGLAFAAKLLKDYCASEPVAVVRQFGSNTGINFPDDLELFQAPAIPVNAPPPKI